MIPFRFHESAYTGGNRGQTTYQAVKDIVKREGILGLYSGLGSSLWGIAVTNG